MDEQTTCKRQGCDVEVPWRESFAYAAGVVGSWWYCEDHRGNN